MFGDMHRRKQGDLGEAAAIEWLTRVGATVWVPLFHSADADLIAQLDDRLLRVQVKTCAKRTPAGHFEVQICTYGGNRSWNGLVKYLDASRCDYLFVLVANDRRWFIPVDALECRRCVTLGGPKYAEYEIDRDRLGGIATLHSSIVRGDARAAKGT